MYSADHPASVSKLHFIISAMEDILSSFGGILLCLADRNGKTTNQPLFNQYHPYLSNTNYTNRDLIPSA